MSVIIVGINKPKDCKFCRHNIEDLFCDLNKGFIDRDDWTCNRECPIKQLPDKYDLPVDICARIIPDAQLNIVKRSDRCYVVECSHCGASRIVGSNVPFDHYCENKIFCGKCGAKLKKGIDMCEATLTD